MRRLGKGVKYAPNEEDLGRITHASGEKNAKRPEAEDEAAPNVAIVLLLQAILDLIPGTTMEWHLNHIHLQGVFRKGKFSAFTNGGLRSKKGQGIIAIVEAKRRARATRQGLIKMQEGAEMVGMLLSENARMALKD